MRLIRFFHVFIKPQYSQSGRSFAALSYAGSTKSFAVTTQRRIFMIPSYQGGCAMQTQKPLFLVLFILISILLLGVTGASAAADSPQAIADSLTQAKTLDEQLAVFDRLGRCFPAELEAGFWDLPLDVTPAESIESLQIPTSFDHAVEDRNALSMDSQETKLIVLRQRNGRTMLCGHLMARLPQAMRATTMAEATSVIYLTHYPYKEYIFYQLYLWTPGNNTVYRLVTHLEPIPVNGYEVFQEELNVDQQFWRCICTLLYPDNLRLSEEQATFSAQQTGTACYIDGVILNNAVNATLVTPTVVEGLPVIGIGALDNANVNQVIVSEGTVWLANYVFSRLSNIQAVTLPSSLCYIGYDAFAGCRYLITLSLPEGLETCDPEVLNGCTNLRRLYLPSSLQTPINLSDCSCVTVYTPEGSVAMLEAQRQGIPTVACASAEDMTVIPITRTVGASYGILDGAGILLDYFINNRITEIPSEIDGVPIHVLAEGSLHLSDAYSHLKLVLPEGLREVQTGALQLPKGSKVFIPASVESLTSADLATYAVYAQPNSTAYRLANGAARQTSACEDVDTFLKAESINDFLDLSYLARNWPLDRKLMLIDQAVIGFSDDLNPKREQQLHFKLSPDDANTLLPKNWSNLKAINTKKLPKALAGKKTLILEANVAHLGVLESRYVLGDFMAKLPPEYLPRTTEEIECIVVIRARVIESGYQYTPTYTSFHRYYDVYAYAPNGKKVYDLYQIRKKAKKQGLTSEINGEEVPIEAFWPIIESFFQ